MSQTITKLNCLRASRFAAIAGLGACCVLASAPLQAQSTWTAAGTTTGNWDSTTAPGWTSGGVPNATGAAGSYTGTSTTTTTQNITAGVTVGALTLGGSSNVNWNFTLTNTLTFNQDGTGSGAATITNADTSATASNYLAFGAGTMTLADDLIVSNTGGSTAASGAIQILSTITGAGNLTLSSVSNTVTSATSFAGAIRLQGGTNTFTGSVLVQKGAVTFNNAASFGNSGNVITLGQSGQGSATLDATTGIVLPNNIVVAAGTGGTSVLGTVSTGNGGYSGTITLNGNLTTTSVSTGTTGVSLSGVISGSGSLTKVGSGLTTLTANNTFTGTATISAGTLAASGATTGTGATATTNKTLGAVTSIVVNGSGTLLFGAANQASAAAAVSLGSATGTAKIDAGGVAQGTLATAGLGALTLTANGTIDLTGTSILHFSASPTAASGAVLSVLDWNGTATTGAGSELLKFGTTNSDLGFLSQIQFVNPSGYAAGTYSAVFATLDPGEVVPGSLITAVPEPATYFGGSILLGVAGWRKRRACQRIIARVLSRAA